MRGRLTLIQSAMARTLSSASRPSGVSFYSTCGGTTFKAVRRTMQLRIDSDEFHAGIHKGRNERQITGQAVELGNDPSGLILLGAYRT